MGRKLRVGVLFGGRSTEHAISLISARNVIQALDPNKYEVIPIGISQSGTWLLQTDEIQQLLDASDESIHQAELSLHAHPQNSVTLVQRDEGQALLNLSGRETLHYIDVVFPVLHGPYGEDGTIQGLLKTAQVPFVGAGVLASAAGMDKDVMKRLLRDAGLPIARFVCVHRHQRANLDTEAIIQDLKLPLFVKPANAGSSVGVSKVKNPAELGPAIDAALRYDHKILIEEAIAGREIECAVLGNETPQASIAGELKPKGEFYSYEAKYIEADGAQLIIPAPITPEQMRTVQDLAIRAYQAICCEGMARVDFFLNEQGEFIVNELNTIPGFTAISMYPKLWEASGLEYSSLLSKLIELALQRFQAEQSLQTQFTSQA